MDEPIEEPRQGPEVDWDAVLRGAGFDPDRGAGAPTVNDDGSVSFHGPHGEEMRIRFGIGAPPEDVLREFSPGQQSIRPENIFTPAYWEARFSSLSDQYEKRFLDQAESYNRTVANVEAHFSESARMRRNFRRAASWSLFLYGLGVGSVATALFNIAANLIF